MKSKISSIPVNVRIGVFGHYGHTNMGDEATIQAIIQNIRNRLPKALIVCFSSNPDDSFQRHHVTSYPIARSISLRNEDESKNDEKQKLDVKRYRQALKSMPILYCLLRNCKHISEVLMQVIPELLFIRKSLKILNDIDVLLITGSNQFVDNFGGTWAFPYDLLKWSIMARLKGAKVYYISVGAGPISSRLSYRFILWALKLADYISFRDEASRELIEQAGFKGTAYVYPDLAHSLDIVNPHLKGSHKSLDESLLPVVGINPMPLFDSRYWYATDDQMYNTFLQKLASFSSRLVSEGYPVFFFSTQRKDEDVIDDIIKLLDKEIVDKVGLEQIKRKSPSVEECMVNILKADIVVASRFHGTILSLTAERPVVAISYWRKTRDVMREMGQEDYVVDFDSVALEDLWKCFQKLVKNYTCELDKIRMKKRDYLLALDRQYDYLFNSGALHS
jgi:polysaccharide pyruvyl transferase WcaK-like protein